MMLKHYTYIPQCYELDFVRFKIGALKRVIMGEDEGTMIQV